MENKNIDNGKDEYFLFPILSVIVAFLFTYINGDGLGRQIIIILITFFVTAVLSFVVALFREGGDE